MNLQELRNQIDKIDTQILDLLTQRIGIVEKVGELKKKDGTKGVYIRPEREDDMMKRLLEKGAGKFPREAIFTIWRTIISGSLQVENPFRVITTKDAAPCVHEYFGHFTKYELVETPADVLKAMTDHDVGVLPQNFNWQELPQHYTVFANIKNYKAFAHITEK